MTIWERLNQQLEEKEALLDGAMIASQEREPDRESAESPADEQERLEKEERRRSLQEKVVTRGTPRVRRSGRRLYNVASVVLCVLMIGMFLYMVSEMPRVGDPEAPTNNEVPRRYIEQGLEETGAVNIVTGMILDYRAFDTLGESTVLFAAVMVVFLLLRLDPESEKFSSLARDLRTNPGSDTFYEPKDDHILQYTARFLCPVIWLLGIYVVLNGHLSPGGGFSGGTLIGAGLVLHVSAFGFSRTRKFFTYRTYQGIVVGALLTYALSKCYSFYTGANGMESIIPLGTPGAILSSGLILLLNICVGMIVACTVYVLYAIFRKGEV